MKSGVLLVDKPADFTSFDVLASLRRPMGTKKLGHTGTLDPMATGVLPVLVEHATRAAELLPESGKAYRAGFQLGVTTDTEDSTGRILQRREFSCTAAELEAACVPLRGEILQIPPMYSAVKKDGVRLYDLARKGVTVERTPRPITVRQLTVESFLPEAGSGVLQISCSKGTYIRTLIADLGENLGCGAVMTSLRRIMACGFREEETVPLQMLREMPAEEIEALLRPVDSLFAPYPAVTVTAAQARRFANGGALDLSRVRLPEETVNGDLLRIYAPEGLFLGLGVYRAGIELGLRKLFITNDELKALGS